MRVLFEFRKKIGLLIRLATNHDTVDLLEQSIDLFNIYNTAIEHNFKLRVRLL